MTDGLVERLNKRAEQLDDERIFVTAELLFEAATEIARLRAETEWRAIETAPTSDKRGFIAAIITDEGVEGIEWLSGVVESDGKRWCLNSGNRNSFPATHWLPIPGEGG